MVLTGFFARLGEQAYVAVATVTGIAVLVIAAVYALNAVIGRTDRRAEREDHERLAEDCRKSAEAHRELARHAAEEGDAEKEARMNATARQQDRMAIGHERIASRLR